MDNKKTDMKTSFKLLLVAFAFVMIHGTLLAQVPFKNVPAQSKVLVKGTSTVHDWEMESTIVNIEMGVEHHENKISIDDVKFSSLAKGLKSKHSLMDEKALDALKVKQHPEIKFSQSEGITVATQGKSFSGTLQGKLEIAGVSQTIKVPFSGTFKSDQAITVNGVVKLKMSDFGIKPPTAMMGTIKTGDDFVLEYSIDLKTNQSISASK
ncbi:protein containing YceI-like domain [Bacteroidales bacterium 6E]|nr:protein containing YceI-like domain [Bacteroidales bacterium 6E]